MRPSTHSRGASLGLVGFGVWHSGFTALFALLLGVSWWRAVLAVVSRRPM